MAAHAPRPFSRWHSPGGSNTNRWRWNKAAVTLVSWSRIAHDDLEQIDMTKDLDSAAGLAMRPVADGGRFDDTSIVLHWLTVLLIIGQFTSAWLREAVDHESSLAVAILATHRTMGVLTWIVGLLRLVWRHNFAYLPPFPESMPKLQQSIAKANEYGLYALLLLQPITGLGNVLFHGRPFSLLIWEVPVLLEPNPAIRGLLVRAHELGARALVVLIGLHAGAALFHGLVLRDGVLQRMLPWTSRESRVARVTGSPGARLR
jgi:superoxide oxidase